MAVVAVYDEFQVLRKTLGQMLESAGHRAVVCESVKEMARGLTQGEFDLVLVEAKDGYPLLKQHRDVPVIMMAGYLTDFIENTLYELGAAKVIGMPFDFGKMRETIGSLV